MILLNDYYGYLTNKKNKNKQINLSPIHKYNNNKSNSNSIRSSSRKLKRTQFSNEKIKINQNQHQKNIQLHQNNLYLKKQTNKYQKIEKSRIIQNNLYSNRNIVQRNQMYVNNQWRNRQDNQYQQIRQIRYSQHLQQNRKSRERHSTESKNRKTIKLNPFKSALRRSRCEDIVKDIQADIKIKNKYEYEQILKSVQKQQKYKDIDEKRVRSSKGIQNVVEQKKDTQINQYFEKKKQEKELMKFREELKKTNQSNKIEKNDDSITSSIKRSLIRNTDSKILTNSPARRLKYVKSQEKFNFLEKQINFNIQSPQNQYLLTPNKKSSRVKTNNHEQKKIQQPIPPYLANIQYQSQVQVQGYETLNVKQSVEKQIEANKNDKLNTQEEGGENETLV